MIHAERIVLALLENEEQTEFPFGMPSSEDIEALIQGTLIRLRADQEKEFGKPVEDYSVSDHGVQNCQYWQGAGTSFTSWDDAFTGTGSNAYEAMEEALSEAAGVGWDIRDIKNEFNPDDGDVVERVVREANPGMDEDDFTTEDMYYYVVLYVEGVPPIEEPGAAPVAEAEQQQFPLEDPVHHDPETADMLNSMTDYVSRRELKPGDEAIAGTGIVSDIIDACLDLLRHIHPSGYDNFVAKYSEELEMVKNASQLEDDTVLHEFQEKVFGELSAYCPPYTYFGFNEADGSVGCWPNMDRIREETTEGVLNFYSHGSPEYADFIQDGADPEASEYTWIWDDNHYNGSLYRSEGAEFLWHY